jgi:hypothetical protein
MRPHMSLGFLWFRARLYYSFAVAFPQTGTRSCNYKLSLVSMPL